MLDPTKNFAKVTLLQGYSDTDTTVQLRSGQGLLLPDPALGGSFNLVWYNATDYGDPSDDPYKEIVRCTSITDDTLTIVRAQEGTTATAKNIGSKTYKMILAVTKKTIDDIGAFIASVQASIPASTSNLAEGTNLYFTNERVDDRVAVLIQNGTGISWTYDDPSGTLTPTVSLAPFTTADLASSLNKRYVTDAQLSVLQNTSGVNTGDQTSIVGISGTKAQFNTALSDGDFLFVGDITQYTDEMAQDAVGTILTDTATIDFTYDDPGNKITASVIQAGIDHGSISGLGDDDHTQYHNDARALTWLGTRSTADLPEGSNLYFTTERAQDAVGAMFRDTATIDLTYDDAGNVMYADVIQAGIDHGSISGLGDDDHTQYHTDARALTWLGTRSTSDLAEGSRLYFTNKRAQDAIGLIVDSSLVYNGTSALLSRAALTGDITAPLGSNTTTLKNTGTAGTYTKVTTDAQGRVTSGNTASLSDLSAATANLDIGSNRLINVSDPVSSQDAATKAYVDALAAGLSPKSSCRVATTASLTATYANGSSGVGATLTNSGSLAALSIDGVSLAVNDRVLVKNQSSSLQNGMYKVTTVGSGSVAWVLTRVTDYDSSTEIVEGTFTIIDEGTSNVGTLWIMTTSGTITVGTTGIAFTQLVVASQTVSLTGDITGSGAGTISTTLATVNSNVGSFGSATQVPSFTVNAKGLITVASNVSIQIAESQVTGLTTDLSNKQPLDSTLTSLAAYNTNGLLTQTSADTFTGRTITGTTNRVSITNGDGVAGNPTIDISSSYVGQSSITTLGTITTGVWNGTRVTFANISQGSALSVLGVTGNATADVASITGTANQVLRVNGAGTALAFGAIDISQSAAVSGTLAVGNGGTGQTSYTNGQLLIGNTTGNTLTKATLTGTSNQITVTNGGGSITLSTPQDIATASSPTFAGLTITGAATINSANGSTATIIKGATDNNLAYFDATNDRVIIGGSTLSNGGVTVPASKFTVSGTVTQNSVNASGAVFFPIVISNQAGLNGVSFHPILQPSAALSVAYGQIGIVQVNDNSGTSNNITQLHTNFYRTDTKSTYAGTLSEVNNFYIAGGSYSASTTVTTEIGFRCTTLSKGSTIWGMYIDTNNAFIGGNLGIGTTSFGASAAKVLAIANGTAPGSLANCIQIYSVSGAATVKGGGGSSTVTTFGPAGPHCAICGHDFWEVASLNEKWKSWCFVCGVCGEKYQGGPKNVLNMLDKQQRKEILKKGMTFGEVRKIMHIV